MVGLPLEIYSDRKTCSGCMPLSPCPGHTERPCRQGNSSGDQRRECLSCSSSSMRRQMIPNQLVATVTLPDQLRRSWHGVGELPLQVQRLIHRLGHHHASRGQPYANTTSYGAEDENTLVHGNFEQGLSRNRPLAHPGCSSDCRRGRHPRHCTIRGAGGLIEPPCNEFRTSELDRQRRHA